MPDLWWFTKKGAWVTLSALGLHFAPESPALSQGIISKEWCHLLSCLRPMVPRSYRVIPGEPSPLSASPAEPLPPSPWERGSGGVQSTGVSQRVRVTGRDESQSVPSPEKLLKTRDLELPFFEGSLPSCSPHSAGYTRTFLHPYFPVSNPRDLIGTQFSMRINPPPT